MQDYNENEKIEEEVTESCEFSPHKRVLMIVTNVDRFDEHHKTGVWFEEFAKPYLAFLKEGFFVTVASLKGGKAPLDPESDNFIEDIKWKAAKKILEDTTPLESIDYTLYDAVVFPGGHGPMYDLANSELIGEIVNYFNSNDKIIAAVCHGPAALLPAEKDGIPFVKGRKVTCFTDDEEIKYKKDKLTPFFLEDALKEKGAFFMEEPEGTINIIEDDNLITGQNFQSSEQFAQTVIKHLKQD